MLADSATLVVTLMAFDVMLKPWSLTAGSQRTDLNPVPALHCQTIRTFKMEQNNV